MENLSTLNLHKICRTCLSQSDQLYSIYSEFYEDQTETEIEGGPCIYEILISVSSIKVDADDGLPSMICTKCFDMAHISFKFQKQCDYSQTLLHAYLKQYPLRRSSTDLDLLEQMHKHVLVAPNQTNCLEPSNFFVIQQEAVAIKDECNVDTSHVTSQISEEISDGDSSDLVSPSDDNISNLLDQSERVEGGPKEKHRDKTYSCSLCEKTYKYSNSLRVHMRNHTHEKPYSCKVCGKCFKQYGSLVYHKRSHTGEQPYACKLCGKKYKQSGTLTAHMRVHTGQRPFLCSICGRGFRQAPDLRYHMRSHTKEKPYMCNICGKTMSMQSHLVQHMRIHTGEKPYKCNICEKAFPSSTRLKRHTIIHTSLKPYTCEVCSKSFNRTSSLKVHSKIHTDERTHVCPICSKGFIQAHALKSHLVSHSSEMTKKSVM